MYPKDYRHEDDDSPEVTDENMKAMLAALRKLSQREGW